MMVFTLRESANARNVSKSAEAIPVPAPRCSFSTKNFFKTATDSVSSLSAIVPITWRCWFNATQNPPPVLQIAGLDVQKVGLLVE